MLELLVTEADLNIGLQKAKTELDDFLVSSKESLVHGQKESAVDVLVNECLDTFVSSYYALSDALKRSTYLKKESRRDEVIWNFSLSYASTAVLNLIERKMGRDLDISHSDLGSLAPINPDDLKGKGQYSMLSASMVGLRSYVLASGQGGNIVYKLAHFFNGLESLATNEAGLACSDEGLEKELNKIKPRTNAYGLSFREKVRTRKGRTRTNGNGNGSKELLADQMPDALPDYEATKVRLEHVVGNTEV
ncbi:MAG: hypothetical protein KKG59_06850, partial [Nanoarchaeota archaeon]|nr:hypothetical protein [Nanoarchaeota archaeon]